MTKGFAKMMAANEKPLEQRILTMENYLGHRAALQGMVEMMQEQRKDLIAEKMALVDIKEEMVTTKDGT
jgi:hypothetical protein